MFTNFGTSVILFNPYQNKMGYYLNCYMEINTQEQLTLMASKAPVPTPVFNQPLWYFCTM